MGSTSDNLLTELEIKALLTRERYYRDTAQWQKLRDSFHPDASKTNVNISWYQGDVDGFVSGSERMSKGGTNALHTICPIEVHLNGNKAVTESTGSVSIRFPHDGHEFDCVSITRFISSLERVDGAWKLLTFEAIYERDFIHTVTPSTTANLPLPEGRASYKCIAWVLAQRGFKIKQDLPGVDDPESCNALMSQMFTWLRE